MKHLNKMINRKPGVRPDSKVVRVIGSVFVRDGREWVVSVITDKFILGTAVDAKLDEDGPVSKDDIIYVRSRKNQLYNRTGYKGVTFNPKTKRFRARVQEDKARLHLGYADTLQGAVTLIKNHNKRK